MSDTPRTDAFKAAHHAQWPGWGWMDHASEYLDFARRLERENNLLNATLLARATQSQNRSEQKQLHEIPDPVSHLSFENAFLKRRNSHLSAQNVTQSTQIADLLWALADIAEAAAESDSDPQNLREQISRYVTGMEIRSRASASSLP